MPSEAEGSAGSARGGRSPAARGSFLACVIWSAQLEQQRSERGAIMLGSIKSVSISYDAINESNSFSSGDRIAGRVVVEVAKEVEVTRLAVKAKGEAYVSWSEKHGDDEDSYWARERYFKVKQLLVADRKDDGKGSEALLSGDTFNNVMSPGTRVYPFSLQIPEGNFPSSFKGVHGYITYTLEAKLSRSMRIPSGAKAEFTIYSKPSMNTNQLMEPLFGAVQKKMKFFTSGTVSMNVTVDKAGYVQGEKLNISAEVENNSSRTLKPKFSLDQKQSFFAQRSSEIVRKSIFKEIGEPIPPSAQKIVQKELIIPPDLPASILNCSLLKVEYILKVYLDVPYARDPEVEFPLVILPNTYAFGPVTASNVAIGFEPFQGWHSQLSHVAPGLGQPQNTPAAQPPGAAFGFYPPPQ
ncbi:arrestin domain-containing protein 3-like isoform X1 [Scleropages formosus]|uniref:arrestin domain-containing protein 3-like isoform X1 n=1 Tax=Scleropages formosus TaxID=113540 RepID=UPI000878CDA7|nr:arrestin domain-containing protein 3-like isoform X1 [Scleropages formosus]